MMATLLQMYDAMPPAAQKELYDFAAFLSSKSKGQDAPLSKTKRKAGIGKDPDFYMSPDFDEPLDCFKEYM